MRQGPLTGLKIVEFAGTLGLRIVLDRHGLAE